MKNVKIPTHDNEDKEYIFPSASYGDMTGLIPSDPPKDGENEAYEEIYPYLFN